MKSWLLSVCLPERLSPGACVCVCVCVSVCAQSTFICFLFLCLSLWESFLCVPDFFISFPEYVCRHDGRGHQHAAEAASYVHYPGGHSHHPLWHAGSVRRRDRRSRVAQQLPPWPREWLLLPIPKWVGRGSEVRGQAAVREGFFAFKLLILTAYFYCQGNINVLKMHIRFVFAISFNKTFCFQNCFKKQQQNIKAAVKCFMTLFKNLQLQLWSDDLFHPAVECLYTCCLNFQSSINLIYSFFLSLDSCCK